MASGKEVILAEVERRLTAPSSFVPGTYGTKRSHRTIITKAAAPGAHIVSGKDAPNKSNKCGGRYLEFTVHIFTRSDDGAKAADPYVIELYARMSAPFAPPFAGGIVVVQGEISEDTEIADGDAGHVICPFTATYPTRGEWSLELP